MRRIISTFTSLGLLLCLSCSGPAPSTPEPDSTGNAAPANPPLSGSLAQETPVRPVRKSAKPPLRSQPNAPDTASATLPAPGPTYNDPARPHIILISLDTVRADWLECYGHPWVKTPNLAKFAEEAILFTDCSSIAPTTLSSHVTLFTGNFPHTHGVPRNGFTVSDANIMLPEIFSSRGYDTAGFIAAFPLDPYFNFNQGFALYDATYQAARRANVLERRAEDVNRAFAAYLNDAPLDTPQFIFLHYFDAHSTYDPPQEYLKPYRDVPSDTQPPPDTLIPLLTRLLNTENTAEAGRIRHHYAAEITYLDDNLGDLFALLKARNLWDNALILITSDHGESLLDHTPFFDHGYDVYQSVTHAVALLKLPNAEKAGTRSDKIISNVDWFPTLLARCGIQLPEPVEGKPIDFNTLDDKDTERFIFSQATKPYASAETGAIWRNERKAQFARQGQYKYIRVPYKNQEEFYDLAADPMEQRNLLLEKDAVDPQLLEKLKAALDAWAKITPAHESKDLSETDEETRKRLESLGYF